MDDSFEERETRHGSSMKKLARFVSPVETDRNMSLQQTKAELRLAQDTILNLEGKYRTLQMEHQELKEDQGQGVKLGLKKISAKKDWNVQAAPFEPNYKKNEQEFVISPFQLNESSTDSYSPKTPESTEAGTPPSNLMKQLYEARAEIDSLKAELSQFTEFKLPFKLSQAGL